MDYMNTMFVELIKDIKPEMKEKIQGITKTVAQKISENCKDNVDKLVNAQVEKSLSIPDNLILHNDRFQAMKTNEMDLKTLEAEVDELSNVVKDNAIFLNCLMNEWKSYDVQESLNIEQASMGAAKQFIETNLFETEILLHNTRKVLTEK